MKSLTETQHQIRSLQLTITDYENNIKIAKAQLEPLLLQERFLLGRQSAIDEIKSQQQNSKPAAEPGDKPGN